MSGEQKIELYRKLTVKEMLSFTAKNLREGLWSPKQVSIEWGIYELAQQQ